MRIWASAAKKIEKLRAKVRSRGRWHARSAKNPPHRFRCPGVSNQYALSTALNTCFNNLRGRPAIPQTQNFGPHAGSQVDTIFITFRFWAYLVLFWQSLLRCCSSRSNFWRLGTLRDRFWKGSGLVLEGFLVGFLG